MFRFVGTNARWRFGAKSFSPSRRYLDTRGQKIERPRKSEEENEKRRRRGKKILDVLLDANIAGKRTTRSDALCSPPGGVEGGRLYRVAEDGAGSVGYVLARVRNCSHLSGKAKD